MNTQKLKELAQLANELSGIAHYLRGKKAMEEFSAEFTPAVVVMVFEQLESAERERDELKRNQELNLKIKQAMHERFTRAEAELARRDAAAGEPVSWPDMPFSFEDLEDMHGATFANGYVRGWARKCESVTMKGPLYAAAPPAVLPDAEREMWRNNLKDAGHALSDIRRFVEEKFKCVADLPSTEAVLLAGPEVKHESDAIIAALNRVAEFYELGAQPQKPVVLVGDAIVFEHVTNGLAQYGTLPKGKKVTAEFAAGFAAGFNCRGEVDKIALDAANVKWEVKK